MNSNNKNIEEILEAIWVAREKGWKSIDKIIEISNSECDLDFLNELGNEALIKINKNNVSLTSKGDLIARKVIRKHRLAERLMVDILGMNVNATEESACEFEHSLSTGVEESICTLLGHPRKCPHGADIPEGKCCKEAKKSVENIITTLDDVKIGKEVKIVYINTKQHSILHKLTSFGIIPGTLITVHQKSPTLVIQTQNSQIAIEKNIAKEIIVRRL